MQRLHSHRLAPHHLGPCAAAGPSVSAPVRKQGSAVEHVARASCRTPPTRRVLIAQSAPAASLALTRRPPQRRLSPLPASFPPPLLLFLFLLLPPLALQFPHVASNGTELRGIFRRSKKQGKGFREHVLKCMRRVHVLADVRELCRRFCNKCVLRLKWKRFVFTSYPDGATFSCTYGATSRKQKTENDMKFGKRRTRRRAATLSEDATVLE